MRALILEAIGYPLAERFVPDPLPPPGEVVVAVAACGICHSDAHYRAGFGSVATPRILGHEIAGTVRATGEGVTGFQAGDRVAVHYLESCGACDRCLGSGEQFCERGRMIGKHRDGGYAEAVAVPARNLIPVPDAVPLDVAAVMMCSTATAYHALRLAGVGEGSTVALLGFGGLGFSALEVSRALGAAGIAAVDVVPEKLAFAGELGAWPVDPAGDMTRQLLDLSGGRGFDFALDFAGHAPLTAAALRALAPGGTLVLVALSSETLAFDPYRDVLCSERRIIGCSDHLREELPELLSLAAAGRIGIDVAISRRVPLDAAAVNLTLDELERGSAHLRTVITPR